jgi:hypothetical protein
VSFDKLVGMLNDLPECPAAVKQHTIHVYVCVCVFGRMGVQGDEIIRIGYVYSLR